MRDWTSQWRFGGVRLSGFTEVAIGRWRVEREARAGRAGFTVGGITPTLRLWFGDSAGAFVEGGIGANLIGPRYRKRDDRFSTVFNFGDHLGVGWRSAAPEAWEVSLRYEHYSNGSIKQPNPGENFVQLRVGRAF
nr:acyloxyacyl hydrolase [Schlegelella koreensis]